jgi:hypothetical protein
LEVTAVREEVVLLCGVGESFIIHSLEVARWRGIHNIEAYICGVYIPDICEQEVMIGKTSSCEFRTHIII